MIGGMRFGQRIRGVLMLDAIVFEEIEVDSSATGQALAVVVIASLAAGAGLGLTGGLFVSETVFALVGWVLWAAVTYVIGAKLLPEPQTRTSMGELLRVIGFAYAPNVFTFFAFIPVIGRVVQVVVALWLLAATVVAVRQALDYKSTLRAFVVVGAGWLVFEIITLFA